MRTIVLSLVLAILSLLYFPSGYSQASSSPISSTTTSNTYVPRTPLQIAQNLAGSIKFQTISYDPSDLEHPINYTEFTNFINYLQVTYPLVHQHLNRTIVNGYSLLFEWTGTDSTLKPIFLNAHYDVVPVVPDGWLYPPFAGVIEGDRVYGRGSIDNKYLVISILEAVEALLGQGVFIPDRTVYLAFGHDEEIGGTNGHLKISKLIQSKGITAEMVLDEGMPILKAGFLDTNLPPHDTAMIGVYEKGYVYYTLTANAEGGHSSMPPPQSAIGILSKAIITLEANQFQPIANPQVQNYFLRMFTPEQIASIPFLKFQDRTTTAITMIKGGIKPNVIATSVTTWINHRVVPGDNTTYVIERVQQLINDSRVIMNIDAVLPPSPYSCIKCRSYRTVKKALKQAFGESITTTPGLMIANTDTRWYWNVTENLYRITPTIATYPEYSTIHGFNESIPISSLINCVKYYRRIIKLYDHPDTNVETNEFDG